MSTNDDPILRASEIGEYVFCRRAWWLRRVRGLESASHAQMETGIAQHARHGRAARRADTLRRAALGAWAFALFCACAFLLALVLSVG